LKEVLVPNLKQHFAISTVTSAVTYFAMCKYLAREPDFGELLICEAAGMVTGAAPDILEPAVNPHHRAFGHSLALGTGLTKYAQLKCGRENTDWKQFQKILVAVVIVAYLAHLVADAFTPRGIPMLGR
jgi:inner membrane protein